ncbi:TetR/AcrR family transcriptional regulator [Celerinatantimonas sp. YJH-8]|uniref:TetR/AcrR family transcriptional regulator n=1 Tax=Celerinatantimonas sp. YJH-8 TaxID=3228714 RepID=UPI0038BF41D5
MMSWPKERKAESRKKILESAARLFTAYGYERISIGDVMKDAGKTHGGFYSHFSSKNQLYAEAIQQAAKNSMNQHGDENLDQVFTNYLSMEHVKLDKASCPLAFLSTDVATKEKAIRDVYTHTFTGFADLIGRSQRIDSQEKSYAISALLIGGVAIARALSNDTLAQAVLNSCQKICHQLSSIEEDSI